MVGELRVGDLIEGELMVEESMLDSLMLEGESMGLASTTSARALEVDEMHLADLTRCEMTVDEKDGCGVSWPGYFAIDLVGSGSWTFGMNLVDLENYLSSVNVEIDSIALVAMVLAHHDRGMVNHHHHHAHRSGVLHPRHRHLHPSQRPTTPLPSENRSPQRPLIAKHLPLASLPSHAFSAVVLLPFLLLSAVV